MSIIPSLSFSQEEYKERINKLKQRMSDQGTDFLLIHDFPNICYLSGYQSWNTADYYVLVVPLESDPILVLWESELSNAILTSVINETRTYATRGDPVAVTVDILNDCRASRKNIGLEMASPYLNVQRFKRFQESFPNTVLKDCSGLVQELRVFKSDAEVNYMRKAASITEEGMKAAIDSAIINGTDQEIAASAYFALIGNGSQYMCIPPVISAGFQAGIPHSTHKGISLKEGDTVLMEMSGCVDRYNAPMMRTIVVGSPNERVRQMADGIHNTLNKVIDVMKPGATFDEVAGIGEDAIEKAGSDLIFHHTFG